MDNPFKTYPNGFPKHIMDKFEKAIGRGTLGNCVASGTVIIQELGDEHVATGKPIIYTSADSVFQIAAHEDVIPLDELYSMCQKAREILVGDDLVGRVIARPFVGGNGKYTRTEHRRDYAIPPIEDTILDGLTAKGFETVAVGKIEDIFHKRGITTVNHTTNNPAGIEALEYFDSKLPEIMGAMTDEDILIVTADHGCDPTFPGTDHTREYIPILVYGKKLKEGVTIGTRETFADIGCTVYEYITGESWRTGTSFLKEIQ